MVKTARRLTKDRQLEYTCNAVRKRKAAAAAASSGVVVVGNGLLVLTMTMMLMALWRQQLTNS